MVTFSAYTAVANSDAIRLDEAPATSRSPQLVPHVFCDMDGVVANFYAGMERYFNVRPHNVNKFLLQQDGWSRVARHEPHLFAKLPVLPDARGLMNGLAQLRDHNRIRLSMLTAIPDEWYADAAMRRSATLDKITWMTRHFQRIPSKNVLVVRRKNKASYAIAQVKAGRPRPILIDDFAKNIREWESAGGVGIQHTSATDSLRQLITMLPSD